MFNSEEHKAVQNAEGQNISAKLQLSEQSASSIELSKKEAPTVLIVNDNCLILDVLTYRLESYFDITVVDNGLEAVDIVKNQPRNHFDIILMDINMPMMDGFETIAKIIEYLDEVRGAGLVKMLSIADISSLKSRSSEKLNESPRKSEDSFIPGSP